MTFAPLPDAGANWVDRYAPEGLKPWLKLGRFDRPIGIWLLLLPGWQGIALALAQYRQPPGLYPWYEVPGHAARDLRIVCGHWSTLGLFIGHGVHAIDTGAVWSGKLSAIQLDGEDLRVVQVPGRDVPAPAPKPRGPKPKQDQHRNHGPRRPPRPDQART